MQLAHHVRHFQIAGVGYELAIGVLLGVCVAQEEEIAWLVNVFAVDAFGVAGGLKPLVVAVVYPCHLFWGQSQAIDDVLSLKVVHHDDATRPSV